MSETVVEICGFILVIWLFHVLADFKTALENIRLELVSIRESCEKLESMDHTLARMESYEVNRWGAPRG